MIRVCTADIQKLDKEELFQKLYLTLPGYRQEKINRIHMRKDKCRSLGSWILLQKGLLEWGIRLEEEKMVYGENGKPYLASRQDLYFNLSHSGDKVMCAISDGEVGCDVERVKDMNLKVAKRFFHEKEYEQIMSQRTEEERKDMFFRLWTIKESFMKMTGLGMKIPLNSFVIKMQTDEVYIETKIDDRRYHVKEFDLQDGYKYACCIEKPAWESKLQVIELIGQN